jgi:hypothetical protein
MEAQYAPRSFNASVGEYEPHNRRQIPAGKLALQPQIPRDAARGTEKYGTPPNTTAPAMRQSPQTKPSAPAKLPPHSRPQFAASVSTFLETVSSTPSKEKAHKQELIEMELRVRELAKKLELASQNMEPMTEGQRRNLRAKLEDMRSDLRKKDRRFDEWMRKQCDYVEEFVRGLTKEELDWVNEERKKIFGIVDMQPGREWLYVRQALR